MIPNFLIFILLITIIWINSAPKNTYGYPGQSIQAGEPYDTPYVNPYSPLTKNPDLYDFSDPEFMSGSKNVFGGSYTDYMKNVAIESTVFESHKDFIDELRHTTSGPSTLSERTDEMDINPRVGLRKIDYTSIFPDTDAREVSSESPSQMYRTRGSYVI